LKNQILAANRDLQRTLRDNEVLARIPAESPSPILRLSRSGQILYGNEAAAPLLRMLGYKIGDLVTGRWSQLLDEAFRKRDKQEFEANFGEQVFVFVVAALPEAGYANFYGVDITQRKRAEAERERLIEELQEAIAKVKTLSGLLPICAWCKKVRDDQGYWKQIESFIQSRSEAVFSHSICPECSKRIAASQP
jgi:PAS domain-containing protein